MGVLLLLGILLGGSLTSLAVVLSSAEKAIVDSARADVGHASYALQTGNPDATEALRSVAGAKPLQDENGDVVADGLSASVLVRTITDPSLRLGVVTKGTWPSRPGEVVLSQTTAEALGIAIGDTIQVRTGDRERPGRVVGWSVDPADRTTSTLVQLTDDWATFRPTMWLSGESFFGIPAVRPFLDDRTATYNSVDSLLEVAAKNRPHFLSAMRFVPTGCALLVGVLLLAVGAVLSGGWRRDADTLVAAGMPQSHAWRRIVSVIFATVLIGEIAGSAAAALVVLVARGPISARLGQQWVEIAVPWPAVAVMLGLTMLAGLLAVPSVRAGARWLQRRTLQTAQRRWATLVGVAATAGGLACWLLLIYASGTLGRDRLASLSQLPAAVIAAALPYAIAPLLAWGLPTATRALMGNLLAGARSVTAAGALVALASSMWAAQNVYDANLGEALSSRLQPASSFVISDMPDSAVPALTALYREHGGNELISFRVPDEATATLRVTAAEVVACMGERHTQDPGDVTDCFSQDSAAPINRVLLGPEGSAQRADPHLVDGGKVGLLDFRTGDQTVSRLAETRAEADPVLGGNLPGLVVPLGGSVAEDFGLEPAGMSEVVLLDFTGLEPRDQFFIRAAAIRLAPSADMQNGSDPTEYDRLRSVANTAAFLGALGTIVIVMLGGAGLIVGHTLTRRTLIDVGAAPGRRLSIVARWTAVPLITTLLTIPLAILTVSLAAQRTAASYGVLWILPGVAGATAAVFIGAAFLRTPRMDNE
ncbi:MAG TPA: hypothetical protein VFW27_36700 [Actinoplanes sp.]|nr:hypothetical protein [Actinoplanes sp.]